MGKAKKIIIGVVVTALVGTGIGGGLMYVRKGSQKEVLVASVSDLAGERTGELLDLKDPPTCILYPDDYAAMGGINEIRERGLRIPEDISVAGYDGINIAQVLEPKLTTLCQDTAAIGRIAAERLIELIEHPKTTVIEKYTVDGTLFKGASVKTLYPSKNFK